MKNHHTIERGIILNIRRSTALAHILLTVNSKHIPFRYILRLSSFFIIARPVHGQYINFRVHDRKSKIFPDAVMILTLVGCLTISARNSHGKKFVHLGDLYIMQYISAYSGTLRHESSGKSGLKSLNGLA